MGEVRHTNRLAKETSPYLLQHAHNPVDWYAWGPEALERAKNEDKPIFLSIGYAACHWCHVMERESFEDETTAQQLNEGFVAIKVDREERPDLDAIYMDAVQQLTGGGGWPMSVFLTPDGRPFYGGTYFPNAPRHGLPSFRQVLAGISEAWRERREELESSGTQLAHAITAHVAPAAAGPLDPTALDGALSEIERGFDARTGGWGGSPKFPQPMTIEFLLRRAAPGGEDRALAMARRSLDAMAAGGIHDHLGGGFARYATDSIWLVPHFEKMLYDNAQLARVYVHAWQLTRDARYREVALDTLTFMERDLLTADGGFAASLDADTAGVEGATYVWTLAEIEALLGVEASAEFSRAYGVTANGNWEGHTILSRVADGDEARLLESRDKLFAARQKRPQPARDDKVLTAWNGLAIAAFADAAAAFDEPRLADVAARAADLLLTRVRDADGRLSRSWKDGRALHAGTLEDYTHLADGLLALYQATFDERWFVAARDLADQVLAHFTDANGGFFDTADDHEALITRPKGLQDNAIPSGGAMAAEALLRLAAFTGEGKYRSAAEAAIGGVMAYTRRYPTAFAQWLNAFAFAAGDVVEIAIAGEPSSPEAQALLSVARAGYRPLSVLAAGKSGAVPLLDERPLRDRRATAYVCRNFACRAPVTEPADLAAQLPS
ncbi:MAG TPA: thioredoxin domain-containing protein, partial [Candidatus Limnocylindria bacterium]|nr:thioredoxin domain-containing protein [Candidatus Limnocylindria bacterium]